MFKEPTLHRHTAELPSVHEILHRPARSLRRTASLLPVSPAVAGVQPETSRSIKPRERDLGDLRLFVWSGFLRGQRTILDMPPALQTISRNQYAPVNFGDVEANRKAWIFNPTGDWVVSYLRKELGSSPSLLKNRCTEALTWKFFPGERRTQSAGERFESGLLVSPNENGTGTEKDCSPAQLCETNSPWQRCAISGNQLPSSFPVVMPFSTPGGRSISF